MQNNKKSGGHIPMKVIIPNMITSGNVLCGVTSLIMTYHDKYIPAAILICFAVFFDAMDGKAARTLGGGSEFGEQLDSLADAISFGVAPAVLMYAVYMGINAGVWGALAASFFALCGVLRLARFNVTHVPTGPFQGLPIPAGGLTLVSFVLAGFPLTPLFAITAMCFVGGLMVSSIPYWNAKRLCKQNINRSKMAVLLGFVIMCFLVMRERAFLVLALMYITTGLVRFDMASWVMLNDVVEEDDTCH